MERTKHYNKELFDSLYVKLVPDDGPAETHAGEMLRAAGRIQHDYYNNGFGNNWSGALNYLRDAGLPKHLDMYLRKYATGKRPHDRSMTFDDDDIIAFVIDRVCAHVLTTIGTLENPNEPRKCDMFDFQEREHRGW
jgi:hypothetical protein